MLRFAKQSAMRIFILNSPVLTIDCELLYILRSLPLVFIEIICSRWRLCSLSISAFASRTCISLDGKGKQDETFHIILAKLFVFVNFLYVLLWCTNFTEIPGYPELTYPIFTSSNITYLLFLRIFVDRRPTNFFYSIILVYPKIQM